MIIFILCVIIVILVIVLHAQHNNPQYIKTQKLKRNIKLDNADARALFVKEKSNPKVNHNLDADDLFTLALMYVHNLDDIQDKIANASSAKEKHEQVVAYNTTQTLARETMRRAITQRQRENKMAQQPVQPVQPVLAPIFHDDIIEMHAHEMGIPHDIAYLPQPVIAQAKWAPDPENVHDSAIGNDVNAKLEKIKDEDLHIMQQHVVIGNVILLAKERNCAPDKHQKILTTLNVARNNSHCSRYNINELDALRLVMERAYHANNEEDKHNIQDAILGALSDCVDASGKSTVCLVGRISRYVGALDVVDKGLPDVLHSVDAYRNEILFALGKMQRDAVDGDVSRAQIDELIDTYRDKLPTHALEKIRMECQSVNI